MTNTADFGTYQTRAQEGESDWVIDNPWQTLRRFTDARIGLGRAGVSLPTHEMLAFQLAHAEARDAVHLPLETELLKQQLTTLNSALLAEEVFQLHSQVNDRMHYLQRPDLGRRLDQTSRNCLQSFQNQSEFDLALVIVDGLSSKAVQMNTVPFLQELLALLKANKEQPWNLAPLSIVQQGRVAIGDEVGELLKAKVVLVLIGERPGLSSPDSLGLYLTWQPKVGLTDAYRNCISNVRPQGLDFKNAAQRASYLLEESRRLRLSGVKLKDRSDEKVIEHGSEERNFLVKPFEN